MPEVTLGTITDEEAARGKEKFAVRFNYDINKLDGETKGAFAIRMIRQWYKGIVYEEEYGDYSTGLNAARDITEAEYKAANPEPQEIEFS